MKHMIIAVLMVVTLGILIGEGMIYWHNKYNSTSHPAVTTCLSYGLTIKSTSFDVKTKVLRVQCE